MRFSRARRIFLASTFALLFCQYSQAQRARFGESFVIPNGQIAPPLIGAAPNTTGFINQQQVLSPQVTGGSSVYGPPLQQTIPPGATLPPNLGGANVVGQPTLIQQQTWDPFAIQQGSSISGPGVVLPSNPSLQPPPFIYPPPAAGYPGGTIGPIPGSGGYPGAGYPGGVYAPGNYFTPGNYANGAWSNSPSAWPNEFWNRIKSSSVYRLLERPRWRHTYIAPEGTRFLGWNESDIATTLTIPNFLFTSQPLRISPGFTFNFWEGPDTAVTGVDIPGQTYNAYLAADYSTPWDRQFGLETNVTVGVYTDFEETTSDSVRITGLGLGWFRLNPTTTFKAGIEYLDRIDVKLLPAIGFFLYPTPDLKLDVYFPRPRLAQRFPNLGNYEIWGYVGGEFGGGSWTIERLGMMGDQFDVNDIRVLLGAEWVGPRQVTGFFEVGYVFDREIIYRSAPSVKIDIDDSYLLRAGIAF